MNIIIPMAGLGTRLRPYTLFTPKPLIKIAGKSIIEHLVEKIYSLIPKKIDNIGFVIGNFHSSVEDKLISLAKKFGSEGHIFYQNVPLGTADAIFKAEKILEGEVIVAFADTLFDFDNSFDVDADVVIFTKRVDNPSQYGVVVSDDEGNITQFVEKPKTFVSDNAIVGIYYFKSGEVLYDKLKYLIDNDIRKGGEYQLTDVLQMLLDEGYSFKTFNISGWYDCGNKDLLLNTMTKVLKSKEILSDISNFSNVILYDNVFVGNNVKIENSILKNFVSVEDNVVIRNSILENVIILDNTELDGVFLKNTIVGENSKIIKKADNSSYGPFTKIDL